MGSSSLFLPCAIQELNSSFQTWQQVPLPAKPLFCSFENMLCLFEFYFGLSVLVSASRVLGSWMCTHIYVAHLCDPGNLTQDVLHGRKAVDHLTCKPKPLLRNCDSVCFPCVGHMG